MKCRMQWYKKWKRKMKVKLKNRLRMIREWGLNKTWWNAGCTDTKVNEDWARGEAVLQSQNSWRCHWFLKNQSFSSRKKMSFSDTITHFLMLLHPTGRFIGFSWMPRILLFVNLFHDVSKSIFWAIIDQLRLTLAFGCSSASFYSL